jgi:hypothetical protein
LLKPWIDEVARVFNNFSLCFTPQFIEAVSNNTNLRFETSLTRNLKESDISFSELFKELNLIINKEQKTNALEFSSSILNQVLQHFQRLENEKAERELEIQRKIKAECALKEQQALEKQRRFKMNVIRLIILCFAVFLLLLSVLLLLIGKKTHKKQTSFY